MIATTYHIQYGARDITSKTSILSEILLSISFKYSAVIFRLYYYIIYNEAYIKLLLLKVVLQVTESWYVPIFFHKVLVHCVLIFLIK